MHGSNPGCDALAPGAGPGWLLHTLLLRGEEEMSGKEEKKKKKTEKKPKTVCKRGIFLFLAFLQQMGCIVFPGFACFV